MHVTWHKGSYCEDRSVDACSGDCISDRPAQYPARVYSGAHPEKSPSWNDASVVNVAWIGIAQLMKEAGLSEHSEEKLSVKIEIDTNPPKGAVCRSVLINRHTLFAVRHYDLPSLMAGKLNALCTRPFCKGRDWYDLVWYRSQRPPVEPNLELLGNALGQHGILFDGDWRTLLLNRIARMDFEAIRKDVTPFLESHEDAELLRPEYIIALLEQGTG